MSDLPRVQSESEIQNAILLEFGRKPDLTIWRNNTGVARSEVVTRAHIERLLSLLVKPNIEGVKSLLLSLLREKPSYTKYGLCVGSSDIIGIVQTRTPRPEANYLERGLLPGPFGVFLAWEIKRPGKHPTDEQQMFLDLVNKRGGVGDCIHSLEEAQASYERARSL